MYYGVMNKKCIVCNKKLLKGKRSKKQFKRQKYCSKKCFADDKRITETIKCELCERVVTRKKRSDSKFRFCSQRCSVKSAGIELLKTRDFSGDKNPAWKNGETKVTNGYICFNVNGGKTLKHRSIMEKHLGRRLDKKEVVHHINDIRDDNRIDNLKLCKNQSEHMTLHHKLKRSG